ncbi:MAG: hypothetical protein B0A82_23720 [Alkalinema sp. CACIAM 70d]|nr:MAG: hypothetical protein B0A82_23720 [Alkalinema sp. CACIAM 70d]
MIRGNGSIVAFWYFKNNQMDLERMKLKLLFHLPLCFLMFLSFSSEAQDYLKCRQEIASSVSEIRKKIKEVRKAAPKQFYGHEVEVGSCASKLRKLDGNFLCCKAPQNIAPYWEEESCLHLKIFYLNKRCECGAKGRVFTDDDVLLDKFFEVSAAVNATAKKAMEKGIPNQSSDHILLR